MREAPWSAPLLGDVLTINLLGDELEAAALGVAIGYLVLLEEHAMPGWLPAVIDEHRVPLCGLNAPISSFCFTDNTGILPIHVVRCPNFSLATLAKAPNLTYLRLGRRAPQPPI